MKRCHPGIQSKGEGKEGNKKQIQKNTHPPKPEITWTETHKKSNSRRIASLSIAGTLREQEGEEGGIVRGRKGGREEGRTAPLPSVDGE